MDKSVKAPFTNNLDLFREFLPLLIQKSNIFEHQPIDLSLLPKMHLNSQINTTSSCSD